MSEDMYMKVSKTTCGLVWICRTGWLIRILNFLGCLLAKGGDAKWLQAPRVQPMAHRLMTRQQSDPCCIRDLLGQVTCSIPHKDCSAVQTFGMAAMGNAHTFNIRGI